MMNTLKTLALLFLTLAFVSCGKSGGSGKSSSNGDTVNAEELSTNSPVPSAAQNFDVQFKTDNFNAEQEDKILKAADLIKKVVASEEFKNAILNYTYNGKKQFVDNGGLSNAQIYKKIIEGQEMLHPGVDNTMNLELEVFQRNDSTVGYTMPNIIKIYMNEKFFNANPAVKVTTNMMHEWLHKLGFVHAQARTPSRPYSVPYAIGYLVADLAAKYQ